MDEMRLSLHTDFMRSLLAKFISKSITKKLGCKVNVGLKALDVSYIDGNIQLHTNVNVTMSEEEFRKLLNNIID